MKKIFAQIVWACLFVTLPGGHLLAEGVEAEAVSQKDVLRFISFNVQFLPGLASYYNNRKNPEYRAKKIGAAMAAYDVVGLNEVFDEGCRDIVLGELKRALGDEYHVLVHEKPDEGKFVTSGGLLIASRLPIVESHQMTFTKFSTYEEFGFRADGLAAKGVLHARLLWDRGEQEDYVDVFVTHLEAAKDAVRPDQIRELVSFVAAHSEERYPIVIMGDMNIDGRVDADSKQRPQYETLMKALQERPQTASIQDLWMALNGVEKAGGTVASGKRLDYIFLSNPAGESRDLQPLKIAVNPFADSLVDSLSDHSAVEAELLWK